MTSIDKIEDWISSEYCPVYLENQRGFNMKIMIMVINNCLMARFIHHKFEYISRSTFQSKNKILKANSMVFFPYLTYVLY